MANYSDFECSFYGNEKQLDKLNEELNKYFEGDWFYMPNPNPKDDDSKAEQWGWSGVSYSETDRFDDGQISFHGQGRWHGPYSAIKFLVKKYELDANYNDLEPGCDFYHKMEFSKGELILDKEYDYLSKESIKYLGAEYFRDNYEHIWDEENVFKDDIELIVELIDLKVYSEDDFKSHEIKLINDHRESKKKPE